MSLANQVHIERRFQRAICIGTDIGDANALDGFICPPSSAETLRTMAKQFHETNQSAFTWTGPYGSGKSSLVVALSALLNGNHLARRKAENIFGKDLSAILTHAFPPSKNGWKILPVVGDRRDPIQMLGEALGRFDTAYKQKENSWTASNLVESLLELASNSNGYGGLIIFIDEMGKFLEGAAIGGSDIYIFQLLAEAASRSNGRLIVIGILHQSFEEYSRRLSRESREEWAKIQGRYADLSINTTSDEQLELISKAIKIDSIPTKAIQLGKQIANQIRANLISSHYLSTLLGKCWPLHPVTAFLLGSISRRRFGQNQRSIFGFLNSGERFAFKDFLKSNDNSTFYTPYQLWNYLRANLEPAILSSPDGHRWALASNAIERCEALGGDKLHINVLKTIAIIDLFKEKTGLTASFNLLALCFPEIHSSEVKDILKSLSDWSLIIFKKFLQSYAIFAGSDFNINDALRVAYKNLNSINIHDLRNVICIPPIIAKRHYHATGSFRWFEVCFESIESIKNYKYCDKLQNEALGRFIFLIPINGESHEILENSCIDFSKKSDGSTFIGIPDQSDNIIDFVNELSALQYVIMNNPELRGDEVARQEIYGRQEEIRVQLDLQIKSLLDKTLWFCPNHQQKRARFYELSSLASDIADSIYSQSPILPNELVNRNKPSASAITAQRSLLHNMVLKNGKKELGIDGFSAEKGLYKSILEASNLYSFNSGKWQFLEPIANLDPCNLYPLWNYAKNYIRNNSSRNIEISEIYNLWVAPPYGIKRGLLPILITSFILCNLSSLAIYREGIFKDSFDDVDIDILCKDPSSIQIKWVEISSNQQHLLNFLYSSLINIDASYTLEDLSPLNLARLLIRFYDALPHLTKVTEKISPISKKLRKILKSANDPNKLLFEDLYQLIQKNEELHSSYSEYNSISRVTVNPFIELYSAYKYVLESISKILFQELKCPQDQESIIIDIKVRAKNLRGISGDLILEAFINRLLIFDGSHESLEGIISLIVNKPPITWNDNDLDRARIGIAEIARKFVKLELYAHVQGRKRKRLSAALMVANKESASPFYEEFDVSDSELPIINNLSKQMSQLVASNQFRKEVILAAISQFAQIYMSTQITKDNL